MYKRQDTISNGFYIDALDVRITTDTGDSQGCITNIKGNKFYFALPTTDIDIGVTGTMEVIGATSIRNKIVLLVADDAGQNGWIFTVEYADDTQGIIGAPTIVYKSAFLKFNKSQPIEAIGRYESSKYQRICLLYTSPSPRDRS